MPPYLPIREKIKNNTSATHCSTCFGYPERPGETLTTAHIKRRKIKHKSRATKTRNECRKIDTL